MCHSFITLDIILNEFFFCILFKNLISLKMFNFHNINRSSSFINIDIAFFKKSCESFKPLHIHLSYFININFVTPFQIILNHYFDFFNIKFSCSAKSQYIPIIPFIICNSFFFSKPFLNLIFY